MKHPASFAAALWIACTLLAPAGAAAESASPKDATAAVQAISDDTVTNIQHALDEERYVDAGAQLDQVLSTGSKDPRLVILVGELSLARGRQDDALTSFRSVETDKSVRAQALQGEGIALALLGHSTDAMSKLQEAVAEDPTAWRAWNALGSEFDKRRDWSQAETAYDHALSNSDSAAIVLNNRGFSRLLQRRLDEAADDFVAALKKKPDLSSARTNLRLTLAMKGDYDRAVAGGGTDSQAALLNNAGVAAMLRGDFTQAESLLGRAIKTKGAYYARAEANLEMVHGLMAQGKSSPGTANAVTSP